MEIGLKDKIVVVTGGTGGIGAATAFAFASEGCKVAVCGRDPTRMGNFLKIANKKGFDILGIQCEVGDFEQEKAFVKSVIDVFGRIDIFVNNVGCVMSGEIATFSDEDFEKMIDINLTSVWRFIKCVTPYFKLQGSGIFLNNTAYSGEHPQALSGIYSLAKSGVIALTKIAAAELAPFNIRVNGVAPGVIWSEEMQRKVTTPELMHEKLMAVAMNREGSPEEVASVFVFLASNAASYLTGVIVDVTGGKFLVQDRYVPWKLHKPDDIK